MNSFPKSQLKRTIHSDGLSTYLKFDGDLQGFDFNEIIPKWIARIH